MKLMDKNGKLFGKLHIFDLLMVVVLVTVVFGAVNKLSGNALIDLGAGDSVKIEFWAETVQYPESALTCIAPGDKLAEDKAYLNGQIVEVQIVDAMVSLPDNNGEVVVGPHPINKKALVKVQATVEKKGLNYLLGKQEIREGAAIFLTTDKAYLSIVVTDYSEIN